MGIDRDFDMIVDKSKAEPFLVRQTGETDEEAAKRIGSAHQRARDILWANPPYHDKQWYANLCKASKPSDFYFTATTMEDNTMVSIVPKAFFDKEGYMWDQHMMIEDLLPEDFGEEMESVWGCDRSAEEVRADMIARGFTENEKFSKMTSEGFGEGE